MRVFGSSRPLARVLAFVWLAISGYIPTMDNLHKRKIEKRKMTIMNGCPMCLKEVESVDQLLVFCSFARSLWNFFLSWFDCRW